MHVAMEAGFKTCPHQDMGRQTIAPSTTIVFQQKITKESF